MTLFGGKRGLLVNADNLCASSRRASARFIAHNNATAARARGSPSIAAMAGRAASAVLAGEGGLDQGRGPGGGPRRAPPWPRSPRREIVQRGDLRVSFDGKLTPERAAAPGHARRSRSRSAAKIADRRRAPTAAAAADLDRDQPHRAPRPQGPAGLHLERHPARDHREALAGCRGSMVGEGRFSANVASRAGPLPLRGQDVSPSTARNGRPAILAHVYGTDPVPTSYTLPLSSMRPGKGTFGTVLQRLPARGHRQTPATSPASRSPCGRSFTAAGSATATSPPAARPPRASPAPSSPWPAPSFAFAGGRTLSSELTRSCRVRTAI